MGERYVWLLAAYLAHMVGMAVSVACHSLVATFADPIQDLAGAVHDPTGLPMACIDIRTT